MYSWLQKTDAVSALSGRLAGSSLWTSAELWLYIAEGLRFWQAITEQFRAPYQAPTLTAGWLNTGTAVNSPRLQSVTDVELYTQMEYMLLEPPGGGTWTGTTQYSLPMLQYGIQRRIQEIIQAAALRIIQLPAIPVPSGNRRVIIPDTTLEIRRVRYMAATGTAYGTATAVSSSVSLTSPANVAQGQYVTGTGISPLTWVTSYSGGVIALSQPTSGALAGTQLQFFTAMTLTRDDTQAFEWYESGYLQHTGLPKSFSVASEPPLSFDLDVATEVDGWVDVLVLQSGPKFAPPDPTLIGIPDDWSPIAMYAALGDVLNTEPEGTDRQRADYCMKRYALGLEAMGKSNWMMNAAINGIPAGVDSVFKQDAFAFGWETSNRALNTAVLAGVDMVQPTPNPGQAFSLTLIQNAPLLDQTGVYVQVSRDDWNSILGYAHHVATFKQGGSTFQSTMPMYQKFLTAAGDVNKRLMTYGTYVEALQDQGRKQDEDVPR